MENPLHYIGGSQKYSRFHRYKLSRLRTQNDPVFN